MILNIQAEVNGTPITVGKIETLPAIGETFTYDPIWIEKVKKPLSLSLPLGTETLPAKQVRPYFEGLIPEEDARKALARELQIPRTSYLKILAAAGYECIGALSIQPEGEPEPVAHYEHISHEKLFELVEGSYRKTSELASTSRLSLAGAQAKAGLYLDQETNTWYVPKGTAPSTHIVKPLNSRFDGLVDNEVFCTKLARACGLNAPNVFALSDESIFVIERYDRIIDKQSNTIDSLKVPHRLHQEDCCQALGVLESRKYEERTPQGNVARIADLIRQHATRPIAELQKLWSLVAFNYFIGNCDMHLKNISLIRSLDWQQLELAPCYDLVSTTVYEDLTTLMGMRIGNARKNEQVSRESFVELAHAMHLGVKPSLNSLDDLREKLDSAIAESDESEMRQKIAAGIKKRLACTKA